MSIFLLVVQNCIMTLENYFEEKNTNMYSIMRSFGVTERHLSLFNNKRFLNAIKSPPCTRVPVLHNLNACYKFLLNKTTTSAIIKKKH